MSRKQLKLGFKLNPMTKNTYIVISIKNSTTYFPGEVLSKPEVEELCNNHNWEVVIVEHREAGQ